MFQMIIKAHSPQELRTKIFEAARAFEQDHITSEPPVGINVPVDFAGDEEDGPVASMENNGADRAVVPAPREISNLAEGLPLPHFSAAAAAQTHAPTAATGGDLDARGLRWDERIHAATKTKNKDGTWRNKRGLEEGHIKEIEAQLQSQGPAQVTQSAPAPQIPAAPIAPPVIAAPVIPPAPAPTIAVETPSFAPPVVPTVPATPIAAATAPSYENIPIPAQAQKPAHTFETFRANIIKVFVDLLSAGKINQEYIERLKTYFGVKEAWDVKDDETKARELFENFVSHGLITKVG